MELGHTPEVTLMEGVDIQFKPASVSFSTRFSNFRFNLCDFVDVRQIKIRCLNVLLINVPQNRHEMALQTHLTPVM